MKDNKKKYLAVAAGLTVALGVGAVFAVPAIKERAYQSEQSALAEEFNQANSQLLASETEKWETSARIDAGGELAAGWHREATDYAQTLIAVAKIHKAAVPNDIALDVLRSAKGLEETLDDINLDPPPSKKDITWLNIASVDDYVTLDPSTKPVKMTSPDTFDEQTVTDIKDQAEKSADDLIALQAQLNDVEALLDEIRSAMLSTEESLFVVAQSASRSKDPLLKEWPNAGDVVDEAVVLGKRALGILEGDDLAQTSRGKVVLAAANPKAEKLVVSDMYRLALGADTLQAFKAKVDTAKDVKAPIATLPEPGRSPGRTQPQTQVNPSGHTPGKPAYQSPAPSKKKPSYQPPAPSKPKPAPAKPKPSTPKPAPSTPGGAIVPGGGMPPPDPSKDPPREPGQVCYDEYANWIC